MNMEQDGVRLGEETGGVIPIIRNIAASANLGCTINLKKLASSARNAEYNPKRFAAVIMRLREPKVTALVFSTGKLVVVGATTEELAHLAARKLARIIQLMDTPVKLANFRVNNVVSSCSVGFNIRLEGLAHAHGLFCTYEPELFPGLIYRMVSPKVAMILFVSGKIIITGAKKREDLYEAFNIIYPILKEFSIAP